MSQNRPNKRQKLEINENKADCLSYFFTSGDQYRALLHFFDERDLANVMSISSQCYPKAKQVGNERLLKQLTQFALHKEIENKTFITKIVTEYKNQTLMHSTSHIQFPSKATIEILLKTYRQDKAMCLTKLVELLESPLHAYLIDVKQSLSLTYIPETLGILLKLQGLGKLFKTKIRNFIIILQDDLNELLYRFITNLTSLTPGTVQTIQCFITAGADLNYKKHQYQSQTIFELVIEKGIPEIVEVFIAANANITDFFPSGMTPLMKAAAHGHVTTVDKLIHARADVNHFSPDSTKSVGRTALWFALRSNTSEAYDQMATMLLKSGANPNRVDDFQSNALQIATISKRVKMVKLLLTEYKNKIDIDHVDDEGKTALMLALGKNFNLDIAKLLINSGANLTIRDNRGYTALEIVKENLIRANRKSFFHATNNEEEISKYEMAIGLLEDKVSQKNAKKIFFR